MQTEHCKVLVLGAGPGGYVCGIRAGQLGLDTIVVEADAVGGTCLNVGCIPSKALIHVADEFERANRLAQDSELGISGGGASIDFAKSMAWKNAIVQRLTGGVSALLKRARTRVIAGRARIIDGKTVEVDTASGVVRIATENLVIATGSRPMELPALPFGGKVISSTGALDLDVVPQSLAVVGGGYIGLEIGTAMAKLGARVTVIEAAERILPQYDAELTKPVMARLARLGITVQLGAKVCGLAPDGGALKIATAQGEIELAADTVLVTIGRQAVLDGFGLEGLGLDMEGRFLKVDLHCATSMRGVYAIGDVTGDPMLAHRAMAQGQLVADHLAGLAVAWDKRAIPAVCYTDPEIVTVGLLPHQAENAKVSTFPLAGNGRAMTIGRSDGFVRVVFRPENGLVLGIQAVGAGVAEFAGEFALALEFGATLTDIAATIHAHPTLGETIQEAALKGLGRALHA